MDKKSPLNYFDVERLFQECVDRNFRGDQNTIGSVVSQATYSLVWNSFSKVRGRIFVQPIGEVLIPLGVGTDNLYRWCLSQIELGRSINISNFGTIGFQNIRENFKIIIIYLSDNYLGQFGLTRKELDEKNSAKSVTTGPSAKPSFKEIEKLSGVDKQTVQSSLANIFALIGELLSEGGNVEIDLGQFGKFGCINNEVIHSPMNRAKPAALHGKQTVKTLMDLNADVKVKKGHLEPIEPRQLSAGGQEQMGSLYSGGMNQAPQDSMGGFRSMEKSSPTRRFKKPIGDGKIINELLGAGDDPLSKNQEFSFLASNPGQLMAMSFKKPDKALKRFPPVIDPFSRTLAAPISSQRHYFSVCHRIGSNYTPTSKGFYVDQKRMIKYKDINDTGPKLNIVSELDIEPADEREEYEGIMNPQIRDETRIQARKSSYKRYRQYIEDEISVDVIAPIRQYWISHILELIPADLHAIEKERIEYLIDSMLNEINKDYYDSVRKSILDYILKNENEMQRLGIQQVLNSPIDWGDNFYKGIEPNEEWKHNVMMARMLMSENLCICSQATLDLMKLWQDYENLLFLNLPGQRKEPVHLIQFMQTQDTQMNMVKSKLSGEWNKRVVDILREELDSMTDEQTKTFFESVGTLMANQIRELITKSVDAYVDFFHRFKKQEYPLPDEIIKREYDADTPFEDNFLILKLTDDNQEITFQESLATVQKELLHVVENIVKQSQNQPRPENTIQSTDKLHLWDVPADDDIVKNAVSEIEDILEGNLSAAEQALHVYDDYLFIFKEKSKVEQFLAEPDHTREDFEAEIKKYEATIERIREEMPFEIRMNMFLIDCVDLNNKLVAECEQLILRILEKIAEMIFEWASGITKSLEQIKEKLGTVCQTADVLVEIERYCEHAKDVEKNELLNKYRDVIKWLMMLYKNPRYKGQEDDIKNVANAFSWANLIDGYIDQSEVKLKNDRTDLEGKLVAQKNSYIDTLKDIEEQVNGFKKQNDQRQYIEYNNQIAKINQKLEHAESEMKNINEQENHLGFPVAEFPQVEQCKKNIKPFEELWGLQGKIKVVLEKKWESGIIWDLDPEEVAKDHKKMMGQANSLENKFKTLKLSKPEHVASQLKAQLQNFRPNIDIIRSLCQEGLNERHWKLVNKEIPLDLDGKKPMYLKTIVPFLEGNYTNIKDSLEEIADTAYKQFKNETMLRDMKTDWNEVDFTAKEFKSSFILDGEAVEVIQTFLDDHIVKTQTMKGSPYAKPFITQISEWEKALINTQENLDVWLKVQSVWLYLEPVFSSDDIMKQMPIEGRKFKEVDRSWKQLMQRISDNPQSHDVFKMDDLGDIVNEAHSKLEEVQKGLNDYLESKRLKFPRFFFLSNDELLEILSETKEPLRVQPHLKKCFEGIASLEFDEEKKIHGMYSAEGEHVPFTRIIDPIAARGIVEDWLGEVEEIMLKSVKDVVEKALQDYPKRSRDKWILCWQGQAILNGSLTFWTEQAETAMKKSGVQGLIAFHEKVNDELNGTVAVVRTDIDRLQRCTLEALIVLDVHARDVIQKDLIGKNINDPNDFAWLAQLRYYWEDNNVWVRITNAILDYNYEYLGNSSRLVITPLTDRCYRTLCGAIHLNYGGAPEGPAGTGKTETVKDLSKALARQCVVFNCSDGLDYLQMGKFFKGLASCGAWSCFDEFNRIELEVLSVIAQQLHTIQHNIDLDNQYFDFLGTVIPLKKTCNCFITMNPGYAGRSELPDNLKALFRSVAMMVPDYALISEIVLYSFGFTDARNLAGKIVTTYKLCSEQLSSQHHYDYGMRAVKSVLTAAGNLKRKFAQENEAILMLRAINDVNLAKFLAHDLPLFKGITSDLFPGVVLPPPDYVAMVEALNNQIKKYNLQSVDYFMTKVIQLYEMIVVRHGLMIVGMPFSGKSSALKVLSGALSELNAKGLMEEKKTHMQIINPKSITMGELYGNFDDVSHDWSDGVLPVLFRSFAQNNLKDRRWLVFDGPVDAIWIENMNTVLDDNKKLCLMSGEIIQMSDGMNMIFEPMDLAVASPATVSRCGMVYMEPASMGWRPLFDSWKNRLPEGFDEDHIKIIDELVEWIIPPSLEYLRDHCLETSPTQDQNVVQSCLRIWRAQLKVFDDEKPVGSLDKKEVAQIIDGSFLFSCIWSLCITVNTEYRKAFNDKFKKLLHGDIDTGEKPPKKVPFPDRGTIYDYIFFPHKAEWKNWMDLVDKNEVIPKDQAAREIIVTTVDKVRYCHMLKMFIENNIPCIYVGPTGTGKSIYIQNALQNNLEKSVYVTIEIGYSAQTRAGQVQGIVDDKLKKRKRDVFGPPNMGQRCIVFVDDLNMPDKEEFGAQPPIEIVRQFIDQGGWYDLDDSLHPFKNIIDTMMIASMGTPGGGRTFITPRFLRHFNMVAFAFFDEKTMEKIFATILRWYFTNNGFSDEITSKIDKLVGGTMKVYNQIQEDLKPTPAKSHYTFNLRDFSKVILGICMAQASQVPDVDVLTRLWAHETIRVFGDRLINDGDRMWMLDMLKDTVRAPFGASFDSVFSHLDTDKDGKVDTLDEIRGLAFGDALTVFGTADGPYQELRDREELATKCEDDLRQYNDMHNDKPMDLVLFSFAIEHLLRISRILKQEGGHAMLVGVGGSGRQSLTKLASQMSDIEVYQIEIKKNYRKQEWHEDIKNLLRQCGGKAESTTFLLSDSQIKEESFLEDVNNILNTGEVPNLFPPDEKADVSEMVRPIAKQEDRCPEGTPQQLYAFFIEKCIKYLHIVLAFSPIGDSFRNRVRNFPSLVNCTTIDWFSEWPRDALKSVALKFLAEVDMESSIRISCVEMVQLFHETTVKASGDFLDQLKRHYYVTPTSYLELIMTFKKLLEQKRTEVLGLKDRYENGYDCLIKTESKVTIMQADLEELKPQLKEAQEVTEEKMKVVTVEKEAADKIKAKVSVEREDAQVIADQVKVIKDDCEKELNEALPILRKSEEALKCIEKKDIAILKKLPKPPDGAKMVLETVCILMGKQPESKMDPTTQKRVKEFWPVAVKMMNEDGFLKSLQNYPKEEIQESTIAQLKPYMDKPEFNKEALMSVSSVAANIAEWVIAMNKFYTVNLVVQPKKQKLAEAETEYAGVMSELKVKEDELAEAVGKVDALERDLKESQDRKEDLQNKYEDCEQKLQRATTLIDGLGGEKKRWSETAAELKVVFKNLTGDVLIASGLIAYLGAFTAKFRNELTDQWVSFCQEREIPSSGRFNLRTVLGDPVLIRDWEIFGLPSDNFSVENAIVTSIARRWPLAIDPQGQANRWIKNKEKENKLDVIKFTDDNYLRILETAIQFGKPVLLENVGEELDPAIEPLLQKQIFKSGASWNIRMGDSTIEYSLDFLFFITTKLRNPHYLPEVSTKVTLLNFMITYEGLTDQLLGKVVAKEKPDLETEKEQLVIQGAKNKAQLKDCEDKILYTLQSSEDILADSSAVEILSNAKVLSNEISKKQEIAEQTEKEIDEARLGYQPVALRTSGLFFCISDLANIDPMYQYSLNFFIHLFESAIMNSEQSEDLEERLGFLNAEFLDSLYRNICRSLFEKDKLIFSFLLNIKLMELSDDLNQDQWRFLLTGGIDLGDQLPQKPCDWLEERSWGELCRMDKIKGFNGFIENFTENVEKYKEMYDSGTPQDFEHPAGWDEKLSLMEKLLVLRCIRPDKIIPGIYEFVKQNLGESFINPPAFELPSIYKDSSSITPLIFVLSPGSDPLANVVNFAQQKKKGDMLETVSLGQGQGPIAERYIAEAVQKGGWVVLQNCHLAVSWMQDLEKICEGLSPDTKITHRDFRLWLTSYPSKDFPVAVLQNGVKMTNEPPKGLKNNLQGSYMMDPICDGEFFEKCTKPAEWKKLLFGLCFFHAVIQERRQFGPLGWNIQYGFNESDLKISVKQLQMFLDEYPDKVPFDALKYLTGECNYGGRVTDDKDRILLMTLLDDYYSPKISDDDHKLSPSGIFYAPKFGVYEKYLEYIAGLPLNPQPEVFGLHENADITKERNETQALFNAVLSTQSNSSSSKGQSVEDTVVGVAQKILEDFPKPYDIRAAEKKYPVEYSQSMNTVLTQELQRFNGLVNVVRASLSDLQKAIKGEILLSSELEECMNSLFDGRTPSMWDKKSYPSLKPLGGYINDLKARLDWFQEWVDTTYPTVFEISKFFFTQGFLTGALQNFARKTQIPIDEIVFDFEVVNEPDTFPTPEDGVVVQGLFFEGCRWDYETRLLAESEPKILFDQCPRVWLVPVKDTDIKKFPHYNCPIYKTSERKGTLSTTGHSTNFVMFMRLPTDKPQSHWIKRGVAMLTQLDD